MTRPADRISSPRITPPVPLGADDVSVAVQLACLLEASAPKPGNVCPSTRFRDCTYEDFLASAAAIGIPFRGVAERPLGATIRMAVEHTARWTRANTNLGIILLLAPLARAALREGEGDLQARVGEVLDETTVEDAAEVYAAIRMANPGGLGRAPAQDVAAEPTVTLREAMSLAAERDAVAREYATGYATTFGKAVPLLDRARRDALSWPDAVVEMFVALLAGGPDTLIARKLGDDAAEAVSRRARTVLVAGGVRSVQGRKALDAFDRELRDERNARNPGATADLAAAAIFVHLIGGGRP
ncbi:MAG TPA: triphosphoribosyl-dephospho-CoA synthase [Gemmatimonadaceae bacterium]|nr:triphosphoribosyl-dephospho-CoA synthase [Gemmatimonadaceae bacterium]